MSSIKETVEEFLARRGEVNKVAPEVSGKQSTDTSKEDWTDYTMRQGELGNPDQRR